MLPQDLKYTKEHEWLRLEGDRVTVGITDHAQKELGDITFVELPEREKEIKRSDSVATVESVKAASDIYAPVSGRVTEVNAKLRDEPGVVNRDPYGEGWVYRVSIGDAEGIKDLMDASAYEEYLKTL